MTAEGAGDRVERALQLARGELSPRPADNARARAALGLRPAAAVRVGGTPQSALKSWSALRASGKAGALVSAALLGAGFGAGYWLRGAAPQVEVESVAPAAIETKERDESTRASERKNAVTGSNASVSAAADSDTSTNATLVSPSIVRLEAPASNTKPLPAAAARAAKRTGSHDGEELALMRRVERALRNEEPALALVLLAELEARFPDTGLTEERTAAAVLAHCGLRDAGHRRRAETFVESHAKSVYRARVEAACRLGTPESLGAADRTLREGMSSGGDE